MEIASHPDPGGPHFWGMKVKDECYLVPQTPCPEVPLIYARLSQGAVGVQALGPLTSLLQNSMCEVTKKLLWRVRQFRRKYKQTQGLEAQVSWGHT